MRYSHQFLGLAAILLLSLPSQLLAAERKMSEEGVLFEKFKDSVFTVYGEYGKGTGFLVGDNGLVITNAHVISTSDRIRAVLDPGLKVEARVVRVDKLKDLAAIRIHPSFVADRIALAVVPDSVEIAMVGERVLAIGSPLHQDRLLTTGVVSRIEDSAILSDININPGNSGGPLLNLAGTVIGVNTFGDVAERGQGLAGAIRGDTLRRFVADVQSELDDESIPSTKTYPCMPEDGFPSWALVRAAKRGMHFEPVNYTVERKPVRFRRRFQKESDGADLDNFVVQVFTPPRLYVMATQQSVRLAKRAARRSAEAGEAIDPFQGLAEWTESVGGWTPTVTITVMPKIGETGGSVAGNLLGAVASGVTGVYTGSHSEYEFKGDLQEFELLDSGSPVDDLMRGVSWVPLDFFVSAGLSTARGEDLARMGVFSYSPEVFEPKDGVWPDLKIHVKSSEQSARQEEIDFPPTLMERIFADFEAYRWQVNCDRTPLLVGGDNNEQ